MSICVSNFGFFLRKIDTFTSYYQQSRFYYKKRAGSKQLPYAVMFQLVLLILGQKNLSKSLETNPITWVFYLKLVSINLLVSRILYTNSFLGRISFTK